MTVVLFFFLLFAIETPHAIRTGHNAIFAPKTSSKVLYNDPVFSTVGRLDRTYRDAWGMITMHAGHRDQFRTGMRVFPVRYRNHLIPVNLSSLSLLFRGTVRDIILGLTCNGACLAANTFIQINNHSPSWHCVPC